MSARIPRTHHSTPRQTHKTQQQNKKANAGANHTGKFSRLRFQHDALGAGSSFQELRARLPAEAHSLYYKDLIGNVSSSDTLRTPAGTAVALSLRYPLMGGWKVDFVLGERELVFFACGSERGEETCLMMATPTQRPTQTKNNKKIQTKQATACRSPAFCTAALKAAPSA